MKYTIPICILGITLMTVPIPDNAMAETEKSPVEAGRVNWIRDYEKGRQLAATADKPILLLFQEVPG